MKTLILIVLAFFFGAGALLSLFPLTIENFTRSIGTILGFWVMAVLLIAFAWSSLKEASIATVKAHEKNRIDKELKDERKKITANSLSDELLFKYLGGSGYNFDSNANYFLVTMQDELKFISEKNYIISLKFHEVINFEIGGPGKVVTNAGVTGGGFGLEGFIKGAVTAAVINTVTASSSVSTLLKILTKSGEAYFHTSECEPDKLRMILSPLAVLIANRNVNTNNVVGLADQLTKLNDLMQAGTISKEDFDVAKNKLLS